MFLEASIKESILNFQNRLILLDLNKKGCYYTDSSFANHRYQLIIETQGHSNPLFTCVK